MPKRQYLHSYRRLILVVIILVAIAAMLGSCVYPSYNGNESALEEQQSVWQYLNIYSIYQDRLPKVAGSMTPYDMFDMIHDTLHGARYTEYIDDRPGGGAFFPPDTEFGEPWPFTDATVYFYLPEFSDAALDAFKYGLRTMSRYSNIIIDVRGNGGGLLSVSDAILGELLPRGTPYIKNRYRDYNSDKYAGETLESVSLTTNSFPMLSDKKVAVLMDGGSASASEILAAGLKDGAGAYLVGGTSYGKGIGQVIIPIVANEKNKSLSITFLEISGLTKRTGQYHRVGIQPDPVPENIKNYVDDHVPNAEQTAEIQARAKELHAQYLYEYHQNIPVSTIRDWLIEALREEYYALMLLEPDLRFVEEDEDTESDGTEADGESVAEMGKRRRATIGQNTQSAKKLCDITAKIYKAKARWRPMGAVVLDAKDLPDIKPSED